MLSRIVLWLASGEDGHANAGLASLVPAAGAVILGIGAAGDDMGWLAITGGIVTAVGIILMMVLHHRVVDYDIYAHLDRLEKK